MTGPHGGGEGDGRATAREQRLADEVWRQRLAQMGTTPEEVEEAMANVREATPEEIADFEAREARGELGPSISIRTDWSVVRHETDGSETVLRGPADEGPDAEVFSLEQRRRAPGDVAPDQQ